MKIDFLKFNGLSLAKALDFIRKIPVAKLDDTDIAFMCARIGATDEEGNVYLTEEEAEMYTKLRADREKKAKSKVAVEAPAVEEAEEEEGDEAEAKTPKAPKGGVK